MPKNPPCKAPQDPCHPTPPCGSIPSGLNGPPGPPGPPGAPGGSLNQIIQGIQFATNSNVITNSFQSDPIYYGPNLFEVKVTALGPTQHLTQLSLLSILRNNSTHTKQTDLLIHRSDPDLGFQIIYDPLTFTFSISVRGDSLETLQWTITVTRK